MEKNTKSILFGVCGIGRGHIYETLPIIEEYVSRKYKIVIFSFSESYKYFKKKYENNENTLVLEVAVPWIHSSKLGIDYDKTASEEANQNLNYFQKNFLVMGEAKRFLGKPIIVIANYEPISAMFAYSQNVPVITLDQQSKYLFIDAKNIIENHSSLEERDLLNMFFPKVDHRIINSFFRLPNTLTRSNENIISFGAIIRDKILAVDSSKKRKKNVLVYFSPYSEYRQTPTEVSNIFKEISEYDFTLFTYNPAEYQVLIEELDMTNLVVHPYNDNLFLQCLEKSYSVISTAGHSFLSELMFLNTPVLATPLSTYEQHYSASIINDNQFGVSEKKLSINNINSFLEKKEFYHDNIIRNVTDVLFKSPAKDKIISYIDNCIDYYLLSNESSNF